MDANVVNELQKLVIKDRGYTEWMRKALKESNAEESKFFVSSTAEQQKRLVQIQKRLDNLYDDKVDERITQEFYDRKFFEYSKEREEVTSTMKTDWEESDRKRQANLDIYELSQKAPEIYTGMKDISDKRIMLKKVFAAIKIGENAFNYEFTDTFKLLFSAVNTTNSSKVDLIEEELGKIFEPSILLFEKRKNRAFDPVRSIK